MGLSNDECAAKLKEMGIGSPGDQWVQVELFRWQYGHLPGEEPEDDERRVDPAAALKGMAAAFREKDTAKWPAPFNLIAVLEWCAQRIDGCATCGAPKSENSNPEYAGIAWVCRECIGRLKEVPDA